MKEVNFFLSLSTVIAKWIELLESYTGSLQYPLRDHKYNLCHYIQEFVLYMSMYNKLLCEFNTKCTMFSWFKTSNFGA